LILGVDLAIEGAPIASQALHDGLLINCTHEHILRLLPPFIIGRKDVSEFLVKLEKVLKQAAKPDLSRKTKTETPAHPMALAASR
jgi:acetylornithine/N-succinyldiaminopimelate aminotransferase